MIVWLATYWPNNQLSSGFFNPIFVTDTDKSAQKSMPEKPLQLQLFDGNSRILT